MTLLPASSYIQAFRLRHEPIRHLHHRGVRLDGIKRCCKSRAKSRNASTPTTSEPGAWKDRARASCLTRCGMPCWPGCPGRQCGIGSGQSHCRWRMSSSWVVTCHRQSPLVGGGLLVGLPPCCTGPNPCSHNLSPMPLLQCYLPINMKIITRAQVSSLLLRRLLADVYLRRCKK